MRISSARRLMPITWLILAAWAWPAGAGYRLVDLGGFAPYDAIRINGLNASGTAVGTMTGASGLKTAVEWHSSGTSPFAALPSHAGASAGEAINASGDITGSFIDTSDNNAQHAFRISKGKFEDLGVLSEGNARGTAAGTAINGAGDIAGTGFLPGAGQRAFRMMGGAFKTIDPLAGGASNQATGINDAGTVIGNSDVGYHITRAFVATMTGPVVDLLTPFPGSGFGGSTFATAINGTGDVVGYGDFGAGSHAFLVPDSGPLVDLGVAGSARSSFAYALNNSKQVVGALDYGGGTLHAFYWDTAAKMVDLNSILTAADQKSWVLSKAMAIDDSGLIAGLGYRDGQLHEFLLVPDSGLAVPAPPAWALTAIGGTIAAGWVRLRRGRTGGRAGV